MITFSGVTKRYPDGTVAVANLTLDIPVGSFTVFVGPSGCGKTTSMRMINRMTDPTSGRVSVNGRDVAGVDPVQLRLGIGYVIQSGGLMPHQRVIDNVACVPVLKGQSRRAARRAAYEVLERVGLDPKFGERYPAQLSGGQLQRVGVARALAADPPILLMDEPFSAVDPVVREELQVEMLRLQSDLHKTIVFVTHDIDEAVKLGDAVAVFGRGGALMQYDPPARLLEHPAGDFVAAFVGALVAPAADYSTARAFEASLWIVLSAAAASAFNQVVERDTDRLMHRTRNRPVAAGRLSPRDVLLQLPVADLYPALIREAAREIGGKAVPAHKRSFSTNPDLASSAGRKGGLSVPPEKRTFSIDREKAVAAGRKGGHAVHKTEPSS